MIRDDKVVTLIKQYSREADLKSLEYELMDENMFHIFDVTAEGLASHFAGVADDKLAEFFAESFGFYSPNRIYRAEHGYYAMFLN